MNKYQAQEIEYLNGEVKRWRKLALTAVGVTVAVVIMAIGGIL